MPFSVLSTYEAVTSFASVFWARECVLGRHLGFSNSGGLGRGDIRRTSRLCTNPLPVKHPVTIKDCGMEPIYLAFRSEITPALQATLLMSGVSHVPVTNNKSGLYFSMTCSSSAFFDFRKRQRREAFFLASFSWAFDGMS